MKKRNIIVHLSANNFSGSCEVISMLYYFLFVLIFSSDKKHYSYNKRKKVMREKQNFHSKRKTHFFVNDVMIKLQL